MAVSNNQQDGAGAESPPWRITAPLSLTVLIVIMHLVALGPLVKEIAGEMNVSIALIEQINTVVLLAIACFGLASGSLADHYGQKRASITGLMLVTASDPVNLD
ncbi:MAG: hypothetical protein ACOC9Y_04330 [Chloroflexota bacterium]